jgi:hypothetical protein
MRFSAFAPFSGGFAFSSKPPHGQAIYESLRDSFGSTYEESFEGLQQARLYAQARCLGASQYQLDRAANNRNPLKTTELLPSLERDYQIVPAYGSTLTERRRVVAARAITTRGSRAEAVEDALRTLLGDDFISYSTTATADAETWPPVPGDVGIFARAGVQKKLFRVDVNITRIGALLSLPFTSLGGTARPIRGETYCVSPDSRDPNIEQITIVGVSSDGTELLATCSKPHAAGTLAVRPHPLWISSKRYNRIVVTFAAATNPETRRKINELMRRQLRGVSQWCVVHNEGTFRFGSATRARLNSTRLAALPVGTFDSTFDSTFG